MVEGTNRLSFADEQTSEGQPSPYSEERTHEVKPKETASSYAPYPKVVTIPPEGVALREIERQALIETLMICKWVQKDAADLLGISPRKMNYKIKKHKIQRPHSRNWWGQSQE